VISCGKTSDSGDIQTPSPENQAPTAKFTYTPSQPQAGNTVSFDASNSDDLDGSIVKYKWDFDGDGNNEASQSSASITHVYSSPGDFEVHLVVIDGDNATGDKTKTVSVVSGNQSPNARFSFSPSSPSTGQTVTFDGSGSSDSDGSIVEYKWDYNGDGSYDDTGSNATTTHSYSTSGTYDVKLQTIDDEGATAEATETVQVSGNKSPTAEFTYSPSDPLEKETVTFDGSKSSDPDGTIATYQWDIDGDGAYDAQTISPTYSDAYGSAGEYQVTLQVIDDEGAKAEATQTITVNGNATPSASFAYSPSSPSVGETVTFDGSSSSDPDGTIATYQWDINGDGAYDAQTISPTYSDVYGSAGEYQVTLQVIDDEGAKAEATQTITVSSNATPSASFTYSPSSPSVGEAVTFDASGSSDPNGSVVEYRWDFNGDGSYDASAINPTTSYSYSSSGTYDVTLKVFDGDDNTDQQTKALTVGN
jgi:PKD repeat protein